MSTTASAAREASLPQRLPVPGDRPPRVLMLAQYPIKSPSHGGQVRARAIFDAFVGAGCDVESLSIYPDFAFTPEHRGPLDVVISSPEFNDAYYSEPLFGDVTITSFILGRPALTDIALARIASFSPDVIWLEQPFLYPLLQQAKTVWSKRPKIVYSSANDEAALKRILILLDTGPGSRDHGLVDTVAALERDAIEGSDFVVCINDEEAATLRARGVNAAYLPATSPLEFKAENSDRDKPSNLPASYVTFSSSSYWLNVDGFFDVFGDGLGFLSMDERLILTGSGCDAVYMDKRFERRRSINESRCDFKGFLPPEELARVYLHSNAVIVPITLGAGSNLKTADALASGRTVISTPKGLSGFRSLLGGALGAGVYEADTPLEFRRLVRAALRYELQKPPMTLARQFRREQFPARINELIATWRLSEAQPAPGA